MGGPHFFINRSWWGQYPEQVIAAAKMYGFNAVAVTNTSDEEPEIVWSQGE